MSELKSDIQNRRKGYRIYTCLFFLCFLFIVGNLLLNGKTNINKASDGMNQHYRAMLYYSQYLKQIVVTLFTEGRLVMPHWNFAIGEGSDIISVLHSDAIGDPLTFLSGLIPQSLLPLYYLFNTFIRVYLSGFFFMKLCFYLGKKDLFAILAGALSYSFCFWSLESISHHIYFLTPLMLLPLLILGLEKILNEDEPFTFVIAVCWGAISWLYFFYMEAAVTAIYGFIRVITLYKKDLKKIVTKLLIILGHAILGVLMAAVILGPMLYSYMNDNRMGIENVVSLLYPPFFYERLLTIFLSNDSAYDLCMGFVSPALFALALSLKKFRKNPCLAIVNIVTFLCVCLPFAGKVLNGFSFVSQRWSFAIALPVSYTLTEEWCEFKDNRKFLFGVFGLCIAFALYSAWSRSVRVFVPLLIGLVFLLLSFYGYEKKYRQIDLGKVLMISMILLNIFFIELYSFARNGGNVMKDLVSIKDALDLPHSSEAYMMAQYMEENDEEFFRYTGNRLTNNAAMNFDAKSTSFYWSITNASDQQFRLKLGMQDFICWQIFGYDNRAELESLSNVKYYIARQNSEGVLPYGFVLKDSRENYNIYENKNVLPFGYTYDKVLSYEDWNELNMLEKQDAMMKSVILDGETTLHYDGKDIEELPYTFTCEEGISMKGNTIVVEDEDAVLSLHVKGHEDKETYLLLDQLDFTDIYGVVEDDHTASSICVYTDENNPIYFSYLTKDHHYYFAKSDYTAYFGHAPVTDINITFSLKGEYTFENLQVLEKSMEHYEEQIDALSAEHLEDVVFAADEVKGKISVDQNKYLLLSIPYSKGWKAYVDGKQAEVMQANQHYCALFLEAGDHELVMKYETPGLKPGALISLVSFALFGSYLWIYRKKAKKL